MFWALDFILMSTDTDTEGRDGVGITFVFIVLVSTCNESQFVTDYDLQQQMRMIFFDDLPIEKCPHAAGDLDQIH